MKNGKLRSPSVRVLCSRKSPQSVIGKGQIPLEERGKGDAVEVVSSPIVA